MRTLLLATCMLAAGLIPSGYAEDTIFQFLLQGPYTLQSDGSEMVLHIPVRTVEDLKIEKLAASFGDQDPLVVSKAFVASIEPEHAKIYSYLNLTLRQEMITWGKRYGTYHLVLDVSYPKGTDRERNSIPLDVVYPKTEVFTPQSLLIYDTWLLWVRWKTEASPLSLEVLAGPDVRNLSVYQAGAAKIGNDPVVGQLRLGSPEYDGRIARVPVEILESFPTGDASGTIHMTAPSMERKDVLFSVKTRQLKLLIIGFAALGIIIGFVLRVYIEQRLQRLRNILQLRRLNLRVKEARNLGKDEELDKLKELENTIEKTIKDLKKNLVEDFPAKLNQLQNQLDIVRTTFMNKRNTLMQAVNDRAALLRGDWRVPPDALPRGDLSNVRIALKENNLGQTTAKLEEFDHKLKDDVTKALISWREAVRKQLLMRLSDLERPLPESARAILESEPWLGEMRPPGGATDDLAAVKSELTKAHEEYQRILILVRNLIKDVYQVMGHVFRLLKGKAKEKRLEGLKVYRQELGQTNPDQVVNKPETGVTILNRATTKMWEAIEDTYNGNIPREEEALLIAGKYKDAAEHAPSLGRQMLAKHSSGRNFYLVSVAPSILTPPPDDKGTTIQPFVLPTAEWLEADIEKTFWDIAKLKWIQTVGAGLGIALVGYLLFADSFVGTTADFIKVFFWGFVADVSVGGMVNMASQVTPK